MFPRLVCIKYTSVLSNQISSWNLLPHHRHWLLAPLFQAKGTNLRAPIVVETWFCILVQWWLFRTIRNLHMNSMVCVSMPEFNSKSNLLNCYIVLMIKNLFSNTCLNLSQVEFLYFIEGRTLKHFWFFFFWCYLTIHSYYTLLCTPASRVFYI